MTTVHVRYVHKIAPRDTDVAGPFEIRDGAWSDRKTLAKALRDLRILQPGQQIRTFRSEGDRVVVFPANVPGLTTGWHSIILTLEPST